MDKKYRVGLDIGIGSVGFAVIENDPQTEEPVRIIELGARTFDTNEVQKTGASTALDRRLREVLGVGSAENNLDLNAQKNCFALLLVMIF